jgi:hypothetical protein
LCLLERLDRSRAPDVVGEASRLRIEQEVD